MATEFACRCTHWSHPTHTCDRPMDAEDMLCDGCRRSLATERVIKSETLLPSDAVTRISAMMDMHAAIYNDTRGCS